MSHKGHTKRMNSYDETHWFQTTTLKEQSPHDRGAVRRRQHEDKRSVGLRRVSNRGTGTKWEQHEIG